MKIKTQLAILVFCSITLASAFAQSDAVDKYVQSEISKQQIPGVALLVSRNGQIVRARGYGMANVELRVPVTTESIFEAFFYTQRQSLERKLFWV